MGRFYFSLGFYISGKFLLIKKIFHSRLLDEEMIIVNSTLSASLAIYLQRAWNNFNNYSPKWRWLAVDICRAAKRRVKYSSLATDTFLTNIYSGEFSPNFSSSLCFLRSIFCFQFLCSQYRTVWRITQRFSICTLFAPGIITLVSLNYFQYPTGTMRLCSKANQKH